MRQLFSFFDKKVTIAVSIKNIILVSIIMYLGWEFYWYTKVGLAFVKWHTHLMPFILILFLSLLILQLSYKKAPSKSIGNFYLLFASIIFSLFMIEAVLVISGLKKTQLEKQAGYYRSPYATQENSYYHIWSPGIPHYLTGEGYSYIRQTNMEGFADIQWRIPKKPKEKRILALGDSFTEGDGASFDSSFVAFLRNDFSVSGDSITIMNAGVCGSDPFNNYIVFKDRLQAYKPDIIIQSLGSGDMDADIMTRGGMERFQKDGTTKYRPAPWWEPFYAVSYISRIFFSLAGYDELLHKINIPEHEKEIINNKVIDLFAKYSALCKKEGIRLIIILHPQMYEVEGNKYKYDFGPLLQYFASDSQIKVIDLLPSYRIYIKERNSNVTEYFWYPNGHHNGRGYKMMAETILQNIGPLLSDSIEIQKTFTH